MILGIKQRLVKRCLTDPIPHLWGRRSSAIIFPDMAATQQNAQARVPDGVRLYAVGDIHGRADLLDDLHGRINRDAERAPGRRQVVVYLGDYVDRGPDSFAVVEGLIERPLPGFESVRLKGNHEDFLLSFIDDASIGNAWLKNGAQATLASYGVEIGGFARDDLEQARLGLIRALPAEHLDFFHGLALTYDAGDYLFVHAGLMPGVGLRQQKTATSCGSGTTFWNRTPTSAAWWSTAIPSGRGRTPAPTASASTPAPTSRAA